MVATTKVKAYLKSKGVRASKELPETLTKILEQLLDEALQRALLDRRKTVQPTDVIYK